MSEPKGMSRRTSWTLIICSVVLGLTLPIGAYGAVGTVFNLSDASRTGPDGDARILNNKLGTTLCDVRTTGVTTANCVKVSAGRLLTVGQEPPNTFAVYCHVRFETGDTGKGCPLDLPAKFVLERIEVSGAHDHGKDMFDCQIQVGNTGESMVMHVPLEWTGTSSGKAHFVGGVTLDLHGQQTGHAHCTREEGASEGYVFVYFAGYSY